MDLKVRDIYFKEPIINMDDIYKCPSCDLPRSSISSWESSKTLDTLNNFKASSRKKYKKVKFNKNVTIVNIQSFKNNRKKSNQKNCSIFDEDFNEKKVKKQCANCLIF